MSGGSGSSRATFIDGTSDGIALAVCTTVATHWLLPYVPITVSGSTASPLSIRDSMTASWNCSVRTCGGSARTSF
eukprot:2005293-Prymnesium_polylepis.1